MDCQLTNAFTKEMIMLLPEYGKFLKRIREEGGSPCRHGHFDCSDREGGPCSDEEYAHLRDCGYSAEEIEEAS